jgi:hypothetical protein
LFSPACGDGSTARLRNGSVALASSVTETSFPRLVTTSLLVVEDFVDATGVEWRSGDRVPLQRLAVREAAKERPHMFVAEYETAPFDPTAEWFVQLDREYEARYQRATRFREQEAPAARLPCGRSSRSKTAATCAAWDAASG